MTETEFKNGISDRAGNHTFSARLKLNNLSVAQLGLLLRLAQALQENGVTIDIETEND